MSTSSIPIRSAPTPPIAATSQTATRRLRTARQVEEFFGRQRTSGELLPDPRPLAVNLTRYLVEILAGVRDLEQIARWLEEETYAALLQVVTIRARARSAKRQAPSRPRFQLGPTHVDAPASGVVECVTVIHQQPRCYPIAMRLVGLDGRWRAVQITVM